MTQSDKDIRDRVHQMMVEYFGNAERAEKWMKTQNPGLGFVTPNEMCGIGRGKVLLDWAQKKIASNR